MHEAARGGPVPCRRTSRAESPLAPCCPCSPPLVCSHRPRGRPGARLGHHAPRGAAGRQDQQRPGQPRAAAAAHQPRPDGRRARALRRHVRRRDRCSTPPRSRPSAAGTDRRERRHRLQRPWTCTAPSWRQLRTAPTSWTGGCSRWASASSRSTASSGSPRCSAAGPAEARPSCSPFRSLTGAAWRSSVITTADRHGDGGVCPERPPHEQGPVHPAAARRPAVRHAGQE